MKAIVMAGGEGTRLRPITSGRPKPMTELFGKPILEHTVELLKKSGIRDICFTLGYLPAVIEGYFGDGEGFGVNIETRTEKTPLGTAGGVRACADFIGDDDVLIISGDAVCDFDLNQCIDRFYKRKCDALLVLYAHPEPTEYGVVVTDGDGRIERFIEKPDWGNVVTDQINTGIYVLSSKTVKSIPEKGQYDFGKDLFPRMLREGANLCGYCAEGYWCDVGSPEAYRQCCADILSGKARVDTGGAKRKKGVWSADELPLGCELIPPVYIGKNCTVGKGAKIGPETVLADGTSVNKNAVISKSVILGAEVGEGATVNESVVCRGALLGEKTEVQQGCVIGDKCVVGDGCLIERGVKIWPSVKIECGTRVIENVTETSDIRVMRFDADGWLCGKMPYHMNAEAAVAVGAALGKEGNTAISFVGSETCAMLGDAVACGVRGAGAEAIMTDCDFECEASYAAALYGIENSVFIRQKGNEALMTFYGKNGMDAARSIQRKIEAAFMGERPRTTPASVGSRVKIEGIPRAYIMSAVREVWGGERLPRGFRISVTGHGAENRALRKALAQFGAEITERKSGVPLFKCEEGGAQLYAEDEEGRPITGEQLALLIAAAAFSAGEKKVAVRFDSPAALDEVGKMFGGEILRIGRDGSHGEELYAKQRYMRDGIYGAMMICRMMAEREMKLSELMTGMPVFSRTERRIGIVCGRAEMMRKLTEMCSSQAENTGAGLSVKGERGQVRIRPCCDGRALKIMAEAVNEETAEELCVDFERLINSIL